MGTVYNSEREIRHFLELWNSKPKMVKKHTADLWDERADVMEKELETDEDRKRRNDERVASAAAFLREHGLLAANDQVIDIGCGPGRFVAEFAKTAGHVTGIDFSRNMTEYGAAYAASQGLSNTDFSVCDFKQADVEALGWKGKYDLVFSCTTPAIGNWELLKKSMSMSRGWCFHGSFVDCYDGLIADIAEHVFHRPYKTRFTGWSSYALFNILWLKGYMPYISYFDEKSMDRYSASRYLAAEMVEEFGIYRDDEESVDKVYEYLKDKESSGALVYPYRCRYMWMLWNVNDIVVRP